MRLEEHFTKLLRCPACYGDIVLDEGEKLLFCVKCGREYPLVDGIPQMFVEEDERSD
ncbi:Trm112 family protein [bacterium]|nr:Trm112 family protein [bacterium]